MDKFVKFPAMWEACVAKRGTLVSTYRVALYLLDQARFAQHVPLSTAALKKRGVSRASKWRALGQLSRAGLVGVERHKGRLPVVKVRWRA